MINFEKNIASGEKSLEPLEKKGGLKESLAEMVKNFSIKINMLLTNFKAQDSEVAEIDKSSELTVEEIDYVKEESKIEEKLASLNEVAERVAVESEQEIGRLLGESSAETPDLYKKTEDYINSENFEAAKDSFLLMEDKLERAALLEAYPQFLDYYENSAAYESREWLNDKKNAINPSFDPRLAVKEILKKQSGAEREAALKNYKDTLLTQKEALGKITVDLEFMIRNASVIKEENFLESLDKYSQSFALSNLQKKYFSKALEKARSQQETINSLKEKFPDAEELYKKLFGAAPKGKIQMLARGATLAFRCEQENDFLLMKSTNNSDGRSEGFYRKCIIKDEAGKEISVPIVAELAQEEFVDIESYAFSPTLIHEEQHATKDLFDKPSFNVHFLDKNIAELSPEIQHLEINRFLDYKAQKMSFDRVSNEILARFIERPGGVKYIRDKITGYDFGEDFLKENGEYLKKIFAGVPMGDNIDDYINDYRRDNYNRVIDKGIEALENLYESCQQSHQVMALLLNENLVNWPKVAARMSEGKESGVNFKKNQNELNQEEKADILKSEEEAQNISTLISGKNIEEIDKIFSNEQEQSILLKSSLDMLKKRGKITEEEQKTKETLLKFIEIRSSVFEKIIESKNLEDASNSVLLYSSLVNNGNEVQQKSGMELLKKHLDLVKQITTSYTTTSYEQGDYYDSDANLLRRSILEKGDKDIKGEAQKWFEETISSDKFDVNTIFCLQKLYGKDKKKIVDFAKTYIEKHDLPAEKLLKDWKLAKIEPHLGFASIKKLEDKIPGAAKVLHQEFKISDFWRYPAEVLVDQYNNRDNTEMPYGVIIFPNADHNGAFGQDSHLIKKLYDDTKGKYLLRIMEAEGKFSLARNLLFLNKKYGDKHKISFGLLGGHGSKNSIQFGPDTLSNFFSEKNILSKKDFKGEGVKKIKSFFEEDPSIALISCSTGKENGIGQQISETYGAEINAPDRPAATIQLSTSFDQNGKIKFGTKYYHSGLEMKYSKGVKK